MMKDPGRISDYPEKEQQAFREGQEKRLAKEKEKAERRARRLSGEPEPKKKPKGK